MVSELVFCGVCDGDLGDTTQLFACLGLVRRFCVLAVRMYRYEKAMTCCRVGTVF